MFLVKAIGETAKQSAELLIQYEHTTAKDEGLLINSDRISQSTSIVYEYLANSNNKHFLHFKRNRAFF